ncbi:hypothetical protein [Sphingomonas sp. dw_22]|uniref:hypothetical protein n=1 Tax=Sphingomonas sp. dw_22 TaxID=2721175 RepID=UPI001BD371D3|nr:hypothetical protein [Sphingomonas sp. dw_22]
MNSAATSDPAILSQIQGLPPLVRKLPWRMVDDLGVKLTERGFVRGRLSFYAVRLIGAIVGVAWNYAAPSMFTWSKK